MRCRRGDRGSVSVYVVMLAVPFLMLAGLVVDGGGVLVAKQRAADEAEQAARAGANAIDIAVLRSDGRRVINEQLMRQKVAEYMAPTGHDYSVALLNNNTVRVTVKVKHDAVMLPWWGFTKSFTATATPLSEDGQGP